MTDPLGRAIEESSQRAWPAIEEVPFQGWTLRFSEGFSGRANSVQSLDGPHSGLDECVAHCERWYEERGRPSLFRLTPFSTEGLDAFLAGRGYERFNRTLVMHRSAEGLSPGDSGVTLVETGLHDWLRGYAEMTGSPAAPAPMRRIIERIRGRALLGALRASKENRAVGCGLAVLDGALVGLFDLVIASAERRRGFGGELVRLLVQWGRRGGATHAYLQVTEDNGAALGLYGRLGFRLCYEYWYRMGPA